jgi:hypothetical protein
VAGARRHKQVQGAWADLKNSQMYGNPTKPSSLSPSCPGTKNQELILGWGRGNNRVIGVYRLSQSKHTILATSDASNRVTILIITPGWGLSCRPGTWDRGSWPGKLSCAAAAAAAAGWLVAAAGAVRCTVVRPGCTACCSSAAPEPVAEPHRHAAAAQRANAAGLSAV